VRKPSEKTSIPVETNMVDGKRVHVFLDLATGLFWNDNNPYTRYKLLSIREALSLDEEPRAR
jgi:hypothetical protein